MQSGKGINCLSVFDGISCGQIALERAGIKVDKYFASEIDKYAVEITQKNYPNTIQLGDVRDIDFTQFEDIDLLIGGSPCQNLSICGNRQGLEGSESKLFFEFVRALKGLKPKYFLLENNASMTQENADIISSYLGVQPIMINSALVSAQQRKRLYWTNIPNITQPKDREIYLEDIIDFNFIGTNLINEVKFNNAIEAYTNKPLRIGTIGKGGQGERVYSIKGKSINLVANGGGRGAKTGLYKIGSTVRKLTSIEAERLQTLEDNYTQGISETQRLKLLGNGWTVDVIAHIFKGLKE